MTCSSPRIWLILPAAPAVELCHLRTSPDGTIYRLYIAKPGKFNMFYGVYWLVTICPMSKQTHPNSAHSKHWRYLNQRRNKRLETLGVSRGQMALGQVFGLVSAILA